MQSLFCYCIFGLYMPITQLLSYIATLLGSDMSSDPTLLNHNITRDLSAPVVMMSS